MKKFWWVWATLIALIGLVPAESSPNRPSSVTRRGLSTDQEYNLTRLSRAGYIASWKVERIMSAHRDGSYEREVVLPDDWVGDNYWVDQNGGIHRRINGPDGKYHANRDPVPLAVDIYWICGCQPSPCGKGKSCGNTMRIIIRDSCRNLLVGPVPIVRKPDIPVKEKIVYKDRVEYRDRIEYRDKIVEVEKKVFVDREVEKKVFVDREVEKKVEVEVPVEVPVPIRPKSGYFPGTPSASVRSEQVGSVFAFKTVGGRNTRVIRKRPCPPEKPPKNPPVPPGPVPPDLGQPPRDPVSGRPPTGNRPPGY